MRILVLGGAGAMGQVIVRDLAESAPELEIIVADSTLERAKQLKESLNRENLFAVAADIRNASSLTSAIAGTTVVVNAAPYQLNVQVMESCLQAGCHYLDLGGLFHVTRKQFELDHRFRAAGLLAILGMGAAPGLTNIMAKSAVEYLDLVDSIDIAIGCVDFASTDHPFCPPYALDTLIDEYTAPPMVFECGEFQAKAPASGEIEIRFPDPVGKVMAILTLHSEVATLPLSFRDRGIKNVTFRLGLPAKFHDRLKFLMDLGLGDDKPLFPHRSETTPRQVLAQLIARLPAPTHTPDDCEVIRVDVQGSKNHEPMQVRLETTVLAHRRWNVSAGALDTGVPPSIVAQMIAGGDIQASGVLAPESCVNPKPFFEELSKRTITVRKI